MWINSYKWRCNIPNIVYHVVLGHPVNNPAHTCGMMDGTVRYAWQSSMCSKKFGYICYSKGVLPPPTEGKKIFIISSGRNKICLWCWLLIFVHSPFCVSCNQVLIRDIVQHHGFHTMVTASDFIKMHKAGLVLRWLVVKTEGTLRAFAMWRTIVLSRLSLDMVPLFLYQSFFWWFLSLGFSYTWQTI